MKDIKGSQSPIPQCLVLHCTDDSGPAQWTTKTALAYWTIDWTVCSHHYWLLDDGEEFAAITERTPSTKRWLLMGDDLVIEGPPTELTLRAALA